MSARLRALTAAALVCGVSLASAPPAPAADVPPLDLNLLGLKPVGESPFSGLALVGERPGRLRAHIVVTDSREQVSFNFTKIEFAYAQGRCGRDAGETVDHPTQHIAQRGLAYNGTVTSTWTKDIAAGAGSLRASMDSDGDGKTEEVACGRPQRLAGGPGSRTTTSAFELRPVGGSGIVGLARARERGRASEFDAVLALTKNENITEFRFEFAAGRCGQPAGRVYTEDVFTGFNVIAALSTPARRPRDMITRNARSLRLFGDANGDQDFDSTDCGLLGATVDTSPIA
jgi:hypothetical protein